MAESPTPTRTQDEMPFALVAGQPLTEMPQDLYIPPQALEVILESFTGPLDLLLYLIRRQNIDILDIPIADITAQYVSYIEMMQELKLELAADYLVMAAILAEIKSRLLLPRISAHDEDEEGDPRAELIRRLREYERFKTAAENLDKLPRRERDFAVASAHIEARQTVSVPPTVDLQELMVAFASVLARAELQTGHQISLETFSVRERMSDLLHRLRGGSSHRFVDLFEASEGKPGAVVTLLALLELLKAGLVEIAQREAYAPIHVQTPSR